jgi:CheY-like chemotaxis protein
MKFLLVDDELGDMKNFIDAVEQRGYSIRQASTVEGLQEALRAEEFDALILDLMMPALDGIPPGESESGYLAGLYVYEHLIAPVKPGLRFVVLTAVAKGTSVFAKADRKLKTYPSYRGTFGKPVTVDEIIAAFAAEQESEG